MGAAGVEAGGARSSGSAGCGAETGWEYWGHAWGGKIKTINKGTKHK